MFILNIAGIFRFSSILISQTDKLVLSQIFLTLNSGKSFNNKFSKERVYLFPIKMFVS